MDAHAEFEASLAASVDPLADWLEYISTKPRAEAHRLRERCAAALADDARYRNDERFARVWLGIASAVEEPSRIFAEMVLKNIGDELALFWVARAFVAEKAKDFTEADALFARGTALGARPRDLLAKRRREFERRMKRHWLTQAESAHKAAAPEPARAHAVIYEDAPAAAPEPAAVTIFEDDAPAAPASSAAAPPVPREEDAPAAPAFEIYSEGAAAPAPVVPAAARRTPRVAFAERTEPEPALDALGDEVSFEERRHLATGGSIAAPRAVAPPPQSAARLPFGVLQDKVNAADDAMVMTSTKPRKLVFSTAKRDVPMSIRRAEREDLTINSAIALQEMDSLFAQNSPPRSVKPPPTPAQPSFQILDEESSRKPLKPRAIFQDLQD